MVTSVICHTSNCQFFFLAILVIFPKPEGSVLLTSEQRPAFEQNGLKIEPPTTETLLIFRLGSRQPWRGPGLYVGPEIWGKSLLRDVGS
ncbi:hypothetical protein JTB14_034536 [Gonioctena quinquepunctata]|nr:hypothetical protein JTB14_034536 [Gonioctena quinquepunctata]